MKRILAAILLVGVPAVYAQEVTIGQQNVPLFLILPLILIVLFIMGFIFMIMRDRAQEKRRLNMLEVPEEIPEKKEEKPKKEIKEIIKGFGVKKEKKEAEVKPKTDYKNQIKLLEQELSGLSTQEAFNKLIMLMRGYFSDLLGISYQFTYDELEKELKSRYKNILFFPDKLSKLSYHDDEITRRGLMELFVEFKHIVQSIRIKSPEEKKKGVDAVLDKLRGLIHIKKEPKKTEAEKSKEEQAIEKIFQKFRAKKMSLKKANRFYKRLYNIYNNLSNENKKKYYVSIIKFYNDMLRLKKS